MRDQSGGGTGLQVAEMTNRLRDGVAVLTAYLGVYHPSIEDITRTIAANIHSTGVVHHAHRSLKSSAMMARMNGGRAMAKNDEAVPRLRIAPHHPPEPFPQSAPTSHSPHNRRPSRTPPLPTAPSFDQTQSPKNTNPTTRPRASWQRKPTL